MHVAQVQGWLGLEDVEKTLREAPVEELFEKPRPQGLGLGAKFLPHHKVQASPSTLSSLVRGLLDTSTRLVLAMQGVMLTSRIDVKLGKQLRQVKDVSNSEPSGTGRSDWKAGSATGEVPC
jgi:hypothetical protein